MLGVLPSRFGVLGVTPRRESARGQSWQSTRQVQQSQRATSGQDAAETLRGIVSFLKRLPLHVGLPGLGTGWARQ